AGRLRRAPWSAGTGRHGSRRGCCRRASRRRRRGVAGGSSGWRRDSAARLRRAPPRGRYWRRNGWRASKLVPRSAGIGTTAAVAQPEADQMALLGGVGPIGKGGAAVSQAAVVDELHLARPQIELERQRRILENLEHRRQRPRAGLVDRLALQ